MDKHNLSFDEILTASVYSWDLDTNLSPTEYTSLDAEKKTIIHLTQRNKHPLHQLFRDTSPNRVSTLFKALSAQIDRILESNVLSSTDAPDPAIRALNYIQAVSTLVLAYIHDKKRPTTSEVFTILSNLLNHAYSIHEIKSPLSSKVFNTVVSVGELYFEHQRSNYEVLGPLVIIYLMLMLSTSVKATVITRVLAAATIFNDIDFNKDDSATLIGLMLDVLHKPAFVNNANGVKLAAFWMTIDETLMRLVHGEICSTIVAIKQPELLTSYADIYYRAWKSLVDGGVSTYQYSELFERECLGFFAQATLLAESLDTARTALLILYQGFIEKKSKDKTIDVLIHRIYNGSLWTACSSSNSLVRRHAVRVLNEIFPLFTANNQENIQLLQKQVQSLLNLLSDENITVRLKATIMVGNILNAYWSILDRQDREKMLLYIIKRICRDATSPYVRLAGLTAIRTLIHNSDTHPLLRKLLPHTKHLLHDKNQEVVDSYLDLLMQTVPIQQFKFVDIVSENEILACLSSTTSESTTDKIRWLVQETYLPTTTSLNVRIARFLILLRQCPAAALALAKSAFVYYPEHPLMLTVEEPSGKKRGKKAANNVHDDALLRQQEEYNADLIKKTIEFCVLLIRVVVSNARHILYQQELAMPSVHSTPGVTLFYDKTDPLHVPPKTPSPERLLTLQEIVSTLTIIQELFTVLDHFAFTDEISAYINSFTVDIRCVYYILKNSYTNIYKLPIGAQSAENTIDKSPATAEEKETPLLGLTKRGELSNSFLCTDPGIALKGMGLLFSISRVFPYQFCIDYVKDAHIWLNTTNAEILLRLFVVFHNTANAPSTSSPVSQQVPSDTTYFAHHDDPLVIEQYGTQSTFLSLIIEKVTCSLGAALQVGNVPIDITHHLLPHALSEAQIRDAGQFSLASCLNVLSFALTNQQMLQLHINTAHHDAIQEYTTQSDLIQASLQSKSRGSLSQQLQKKKQKTKGISSGYREGNPSEPVPVDLLGVSISHLTSLCTLCLMILSDHISHRSRDIIHQTTQYIPNAENTSKGDIPAHFSTASQTLPGLDTSTLEPDFIIILAKVVKQYMASVVIAASRLADMCSLLGPPQIVMSDSDESNDLISTPSLVIGSQDVGQDGSATPLLEPTDTASTPAIPTDCQQQVYLHAMYGFLTTIDIYSSIASSAAGCILHLTDVFIRYKTQSSHVSHTSHTKKRTGRKQPASGLTLNASPTDQPLCDHIQHISSHVTLCLDVVNDYIQILGDAIMIQFLVPAHIIHPYISIMATITYALQRAVLDIDHVAPPAATAATPFGKDDHSMEDDEIIKDAPFDHLINYIRYHFTTCSFAPLLKATHWFRQYVYNSRLLDINITHINALDTVAQSYTAIAQQNDLQSTTTTTTTTTTTSSTTSGSLKHTLSPAYFDKQWFFSDEPSTSRLISEYLDHHQLLFNSVQYAHESQHTTLMFNTSLQCLQLVLTHLTMNPTLLDLPEFSNTMVNLIKAFVSKETDNVLVFFWYILLNATARSFTFASLCDRDLNTLEESRQWGHYFKSIPLSFAVLPSLPPLSTRVLHLYAFPHWFFRKSIANQYSTSDTNSIDNPTSTPPLVFTWWTNLFATILPLDSNPDYFLKSLSTIINVVASPLPNQGGHDQLSCYTMHLQPSKHPLFTAQALTCYDSASSPRLLNSCVDFFAVILSIMKQAIHLRGSPYYQLQDASASSALVAHQHKKKKAKLLEVMDALLVTMQDLIIPLENDGSETVDNFPRFSIQQETLYIENALSDLLNQS